MLETQGRELGTDADQSSIRAFDLSGGRPDLSLPSGATKRSGFGRVVTLVVIALACYGIVSYFLQSNQRSLFAFALIIPAVLAISLRRFTGKNVFAAHYLLAIVFLFSLISPWLDDNPSVLAPELLGVGMLATQIVYLRGAIVWVFVSTAACVWIAFKSAEISEAEFSYAVSVGIATLMISSYALALQRIRRKTLQTLRNEGSQLEVAAQRLREYTQIIFPSIVEASPSRILYASPALQDELGYTPALLRDKALDQYIHPDDLSEVQRCLALRPAQPFHVEVRVLHANGHWIWQAAHGIPTSSDGETRWYFVARNIEAERLARERVQQQIKMEEVGNLAAGVAHDFNNLLTVIRGNADLLPESRERTEIMGASDEAAVLTRQMLAFSREQPLDLEVIDLAQVVTDMRPMIRSILGEEIRLNTQVPDVSFEVSGDATQLKQVLISLVTNARDALEPGGTLSISLSLQEDHALTDGLGLAPGPLVRLIVEDDGSGMDAVTLQRAFDPFFSTKGPGHGSGLGLSSAYGVIAKSDGKLELESGPGEGTKATIWLPIADSAQEVNQPIVELKEGESGLLALVVEDDARIRELVRASLSRAGYATIEAGDGLAAMALFQRLDKLPDLLVTDVIMPGARGSEIAARMRVRHPELKVLFISGYPDLELGDWRDRDDGVSFLAKPFTPADIALRANQLLGLEPASLT